MTATRMLVALVGLVVVTETLILVSQAVLVVVTAAMAEVVRKDREPLRVSLVFLVELYIPVVVVVRNPLAVMAVAQMVRPIVVGGPSMPQQIQAAVAAGLRTPAMLVLVALESSSSETLDRRCSSMAKTMAIIDNEVVVNMIWCNDNTPDTETQNDPGDRPVGIGDTYSDGKWYRDGVEILTPLEQAQKNVESLQAQMTELDAAYREGVNSI